MKKFKNINEVWTAIDQGKTIYCMNKAYKIYVESSHPGNPSFPKRENKVLCVRCIENHFGSVLHESDLSHLFIEE